MVFYAKDISVATAGGIGFLSLTTEGLAGAGAANIAVLTASIAAAKTLSLLVNSLVMESKWGNWLFPSERKKPSFISLTHSSTKPALRADVIEGKKLVSHIMGVAITTALLTKIGLISYGILTSIPAIIVAGLVLRCAPEVFSMFLSITKSAPSM